MSHGVLVIGLGALFAAFVLIFGGAGLLVASRRQVAGSLSLAEQMQIGGKAAVPRQELPPRQRLVEPAAAQLGRLARFLSGKSSGDKLAKRLDMAGNPGAWTVDRVLAAKGLALIALGLFGLLIGHRSPVLALGLAGAFGAFGFFLPDILLTNTAQKRQQVIDRTLSDCLDLLVISVSAGLGFDQALTHVARKTKGPLAGEFARVLQEVQIGKPRAQALQSLAERTNSDSVRTFVQSVTQADGLGIPIARVLSEQAKEMRIRRRQLAEERAQKVPVKIVVPVVLFILPALLIVVVGPGALSIVHAFSHR